MPERKKPTARFAIVFMLVLACIAFGVYLTFSTFQRSMASERRDVSRHNMELIFRALDAYLWKNNGKYPEHASQFTQMGLPAASLIHPAWPDQPGYIYIPGARASDNVEYTIVAYENVPDRKRKQGIMVLKRGGIINKETESNFTRKLNEQEAAWKKDGRIWMPEMMVSGK